MQLLMLYAYIFEFYTLITMTRLQFTHAQGLGCTRDMYTAESHCQYRLMTVKEVNDMVSASSQATFLLPHGLGAYDLAAIKQLPSSFHAPIVM